MWEREMFIKNLMVAWKNKTPAQANLAGPPGLLMEKWLEHRQYLQATVKHLHFEDAALAAQELAAAEEEGKTMEMMLTLL